MLIFMIYMCVYIYSVYIYYTVYIYNYIHIYMFIMSIHFHGPFKTSPMVSEPHRHAQPHDALGHGDAIAAQGIADH